MKRRDHHLIQEVLDGNLSQEAFDAFQQRLREEPSLLQLYMDYALLQHSLTDEFEGGGGFGGRIPSQRVRRFGPATLVAAAAVVALMAVALWGKPWGVRGATPDVALLTFSLDAAWEIDGYSHPIGGATGVESDSILQLSCGRAGVSLSPSVTAFVEGPAELVLQASDAMVMRSGRGYFSVGGERDALTLETPRLRIEDEEVEFGLVISSDGAEALQVLSGKLEVVSRRDGRVLSLEAGEAIQVTADGTLGSAGTDGDHFARELGRFRRISSDFPGVEPAAGAVRASSASDGFYTRLLPLPEMPSDAEDSVVLATLQLGSEPIGKDQGRSYVSLMSEGSELLRFDDQLSASADDASVPVVRPSSALAQLGEVTLRHDPRTGNVSLHEGGVPLGLPIGSGRIPAGQALETIEIGASSVSALAVVGLDIRVGRD
jgi:hypothetical protein